MTNECPHCGAKPFRWDGGSHHKAVWGTRDSQYVPIRTDRACAETGASADEWWRSWMRAELRPQQYWGF